MPVDDRSSTIRDQIQRIEVVLSALLLAMIAITIAPLEPSLGEWTLWVVFLLPGVLGLAALVGVGIDVFKLVSTRSNTQTATAPRWIVLGKLAVIGTICVLAGGTLFLVVQTILIVTIVDTGGGVMFGPILFAFTGGFLAIVVLVRVVSQRFFAARMPNRTREIQP